MVVLSKDLWTLAQHQQHIDPRDLTAAIEDQVARRDLDKDRLVRLLKETTQSMLASPELRDRAQHNWYVLFGEPLPA